MQQAIIDLHFVRVLSYCHVLCAKKNEWWRRLRDLFSKLDANDSIDTGFLYTRQSNDKVVTGFSAHVTAESSRDIPRYDGSGLRCAPGCQFTNFHKKVQDEAKHQVAASNKLQSDSRMSSQFQLESKSTASVGFLLHSIVFI
jgi:hypothetical protein